MEDNSLPLYKTQILSKLEGSIKENKSSLMELKENNNLKKNAEIGLLTKVTSCNDIWSSTKYQDKKWKDFVYTSYYNDKFNEKHYEINEIVNPEISNKKFNMRKTTISEYSNALHNNRVFVNPTFTSC